MISGHGNIETAVSAIKAGAYDFIEKPFKADRLCLVVERALETSRLRREVTDLRTRSGATDRIIGSSTVVNQLRQVIDRVAPANSRVLITGGPGTGKELVARSIHDASARASGPFVVINAATITPETMEIELFGTGREQRPPQDRRARGGAWRHALSRRSLRHAARDAGEDPARAGRPEFPARGRLDARQRRRAHHLLDVARSRRGDRGRVVPRGSVPSAFGRADPRALARRAPRGHSRTDRLLHGSSFCRRPAWRAAGSRRTRWPCCNRTIGRATSGSCATTSNA